MMTDPEDYRDYDECGNGSAVGIALGGVIILIAVVLLCAVLFASCKTVEYVPVETVKVEYKDNIREIHTTDSVTDTRFVYIKGDTVLDYRDRVKWKEKIVHDSIYIERTDTIRIPYPVEKQLTKWQQAKMDFGGMALGIMCAMLCIAVVWLIKRFRK